MMQTGKAKRITYWVATNGIFAVLLYVGYFMGVGVAETIFSYLMAIFATLLTFYTLGLYAVRKYGREVDKAEFKENDLNTVPLWLDYLYDILMLLALAYHADYLMFAVYAWHALMLMQARHIQATL